MGSALIFLALFLIGVLWIKSKLASHKQRPSPQTQLAVNFHFTRQCNYKCGFCFHTATSSYVLPFERAKKGLEMLHQYGIKKINFAGGEPFLEPKLLGKMVKLCKEELGMAVSIVSNGSKLTERWFDQYGEYIDILAISVDSFKEDINIKIGRGEGNHIENVAKAKKLCLKHGIKFKINTVVNRYNHLEDINEEIARLDPVRWKVFQVLELKGENDGDQTKRNVKPFLITDEEFKAYTSRHSKQKSLVVEDNSQMRASYLLLDEEMRFLDSSSGSKIPSKSILEVGVAEAMKHSGFDKEMFQSRGGVYEWTRQMESSPCETSALCNNKNLEW